MDVILDILGSAFLDNAKYFAENLLIICQFFLINRYFAYYFLLLLEFEDCHINKKGYFCNGFLLGESWSMTITPLKR
ncbi:MAG: hypothetical protein EGS41_11485 [Prevotella sp.]|nr:hypothetical protein [Prevotella sp.]